MRTTPALALAALAVLLPGCSSKDNNSVILVYGYVGAFSGRGTSADSLVPPSAILVRGNGVIIRDVWVAEPSASRISRFDFGGNFLGSFALPTGANPRAMASSGDTLMYILDAARTVFIVDSTGTLKGQFATDSSRFPFGIAVGPGRVYVSSRKAGILGTVGRIEIFQVDGTPAGGFGGSGGDLLLGPGSLALRDSSLWICDEAAQKLKRYDIAGHFTRSFGSVGAGAGQWIGPRGIALTDDGHLLVADAGNRRVQEYANDGAFATQFGTERVGNPASFSISPVAVYGSSVLGEFIYVGELGVGRVFVLVRRYVHDSRKPGITRPAGGPAVTASASPRDSRQGSGTVPS